MKNYILLTNNLITQIQIAPIAKSPWIEVAADVSTLIMDTKYIYVDGVITNTNQPILPPELYMDWDYSQNKWVSTKTAVIQWGIVRVERNTLLTETDWMALSDVTMSDAWKTYRQALRDITDQADPFNITWPTKPE